MKIVPARVEATLRKPAGMVVLLYGDDPGLIRSRAASCIAHEAGSTPSAFQLSTLTRDEAARLVGDATSRPLDGSRRIVRLQDAGDGVLASLTLLDKRGCDALLVLEAGDLPSKSKLRLAAEAHPGWAAIQCRGLGTGAVSEAIKRSLSAAQLAVDDDALAFLADQLGGDSGLRDQEIGKLILFATGETRIGLDMAMQCCAAEDEVSFTALFSAALSGELDRVGQILLEAEYHGTTGPGLLAGFGIHVQRLARWVALSEAGQSPAQAARLFRPPLYPKQADALAREARRWRGDDLARLAAAIRTADIACKRAGSADLAIAGRVILDAARRSARSNG